MYFLHTKTLTIPKEKKEESKSQVFCNYLTD